MPSTNFQSTIADRLPQAAVMVERLLKSYPPQEIGDPEVVTAGLIELVASYSPVVIERVPSMTRGLPAKFKFFPRPAEIKETLDEWEDTERVHRERIARYGKPIKNLPRLTGPLRPAGGMRDELCRKYGISGIPRGWNAIDVVRAYAQHRDKLPEIVAEMLKHAGAAPLPPIAQKVKRAMEGRIAGQEQAMPVREMEELEP